MSKDLTPWGWKLGNCTVKGSELRFHGHWRDLAMGSGPYGQRFVLLLATACLKMWPEDLPSGQTDDLLP